MKWLGPTWIKIELDNIVHNLSQIQKLTSAKICAVIKSNAYGHGICVISSLLQSLNLPYLAVSDLMEALEVRTAGVQTPLLILNPNLVHETGEIVQYKITPTVTSEEILLSLAKHAFLQQKRVNIHLKVETGLNRIGVSPAEALKLAQLISEFEYLNLEGVYTHFAAANSDINYTKKQLNHLLVFKSKFNELGFKNLMWHSANSAALVTLPQSHLDMVRIGTMLFGQSTVKKLPHNINLKPTWELYTRIIQIKAVKKGEYIGYNKNFITKRDSVIGVIPLGYSDGLGVRPKDNNFWNPLRTALLNLVDTPNKIYLDHKSYPIIGKIAMGMCCIDLTEHANPHNLYGAVIQIPTRRTTINRRIPKIYQMKGKLVIIDWQNKLWKPFCKNNQIYLKEISTYTAKETLKWRN